MLTRFFVSCTKAFSNTNHKKQDYTLYLRFLLDLEWDKLVYKGSLIQPFSDFHVQNIFNYPDQRKREKVGKNVLLWLFKAHFRYKGPTQTGGISGNDTMKTKPWEEDSEFPLCLYKKKSI